MTNKTRNIILSGSYVAIVMFLVGSLFYGAYCHTSADSNCEIWLMVVELVLLGLWIFVLPRFLEMRVDNQHKTASRNERLVFNGKVYRTRWIYLLSFTFVFMFSFEIWMTYRNHPAFPLWPAIGLALAFSIFFMVGMSPLWGDMIYRCIKNTYTIEGENLIIDEWAWFQKKTNHLVIPISEIESIRKKNNGLVQNCNIEIQVQGIKRLLATGLVGDQLYDALKERMA